jgi:hypothetical protein
MYAMIAVRVYSVMMWLDTAWNGWRAARRPARGSADIAGEDVCKASRRTFGTSMALFGIYGFGMDLKDILTV